MGHTDHSQWLYRGTNVRIGPTVNVSFFSACDHSDDPSSSLIAVLGHFNNYIPAANILATMQHALSHEFLERFESKNVTPAQARCHPGRMPFYHLSTASGVGLQEV